MAPPAIKRPAPKRAARKRGPRQRSKQAKVEAGKSGSLSPSTIKRRCEIAMKAKLVKRSIRAGYSPGEAKRSPLMRSPRLKPRKRVPSSGGSKRKAPSSDESYSPESESESESGSESGPESGPEESSPSPSPKLAARTATTPAKRKAPVLSSYASPSVKHAARNTTTTAKRKDHQSSLEMQRGASPRAARLANRNARIASPAGKNKSSPTRSAPSFNASSRSPKRVKDGREKSTNLPASADASSSSVRPRLTTNKNLSKFLKGPDTFFPFLRPALNKTVVKGDIDTMIDRSRDLAREIKNNFEMTYFDAKSRPFYQRVSCRKYQPKTKTLRQRTKRSHQPTSNDEAVTAEVVHEEKNEQVSHETETEESSEEDAIVVPSTQYVPARLSFHHSHSLWNRLLVEDCMFLQPGVEVLLLVKTDVSPESPTCTNYIRLAKLSDQQAHDYPFVSFRGNDFFQVHGLVATNVYRERLMHGSWDQRDLYEHVSGKHRGCFSVAIEGKPVQQKVNIYWGDILNRLVMVFSSPPWGKSRDFYATFESRRRNPALQRQLFNCLFEEVILDKYLSCNLLLSYNKLLRISTNKVCSQWKQIALMYSDFEMAGPTFVSCLKQIDLMFKDALITCFRELSQIMQPIVTQAQLNNCISLLKKECRGLYDVLWEMLGYHRLGNDHLKATRERTVLFHILSTSRVRNSQHAIHWAMVRTAAMYCTGASKQFFSQTSYFGVSASSSTFIRFVKPLGEAMEERIFEIVNDQHASWFIFDNNKKNFRLFYQRHGQANVFIKVTSRLVKEFYRWLYKGVVPTINEESVPITILDQKIPSALGMPIFSRGEGRKKWARTIKAHRHYGCSRNDKVDFSGRQVRNYIHFVSLCEGLHCLWRCLSLPRLYVDFELDAYKNCTFRENLVKRLNTLRVRDGLFDRSMSFMRSVCGTYNQHLYQITKIANLPAMRFDETVTEECMMVMIRHLENVCILDRIECQQRDGKVKISWELSQDYKKKRVYAQCDGLTHDRIRNFDKNLMGVRVTFVDHFRQITVLREALTRVVIVPGPLHVMFHMLDVFVNLFWGGFLQLFVVVLRWSRVNTDVTQCFNLFCLLVALIHQELERAWLLEYVCTLPKAEQDELKKLSHEEVALFVAEGFKAYVLGATSSDDVEFARCANFLEFGYHFFRYKAAVRDGCRVVQENEFCYFIPLFDATGKQNYVRIGVFEIETLYEKLSYHELQEIRINSPIRYRTGDDEPCHSGDGCRENFNKMEKALPLGPNYESWRLHTPNVMVAQRCRAFCDWEYSRGAVIDEVDKAKTSAEKRRSTAPRRLKERKIVFEYITKMRWMKEDKNRNKFNMERCKNTMKSLETMLDANESGDAVVEVTDVNLEAGVLDVVKIVRAKKKKGVGNTEGEEQTIDVSAEDGDDMGKGLCAIDVDEESVAIADVVGGTGTDDPISETVAEPNLELDENEEETQDDSIPQNNDDQNEVVARAMSTQATTCGSTSRRGRLTDKYLNSIKWAKTKDLSGKHIYEEATKKLKEKDIVGMARRRRKRQERAHALEARLYKKLKNVRNETVVNLEESQEWTKREDYEKPTSRKEFRFYMDMVDGS